MHRLLIVVAAIAISCNQALPQPLVQSTVATCTPTIARMVPPQRIMDSIFGGMSPRPSATPSLEEWAAQTNWIGNESLWVSLPNDGVFDMKYGKLWMYATNQGPITITGRMLDGDGSEIFHGSAMSENIGSSVDFSHPGCWEIVYDLAGERLIFTMKVIRTEP